MPYPTKYARQYDFLTFANANPTTPLPGSKVNIDYNAVVTSIDEIVEFLKLHARSDGALGNESVGEDQLTAAVLAKVNSNVGVTAISVFGRTGIVVAAAGDYTAAQITVTPAGAIASTDVQAALEELDTEKSAAGHNHSGVYEPADATILKDADIGSTVQAWDAQLDTWATVTPSANGQSLVSAANYAAMRTLLDLEAGTDFYSIAATDSAIDADVAAHAALTATHGATGAAVGTTNTQTLTNKRVTARIGTTASSATPTPSADDHDQYNVTALAVGATFGAPTGTPTNGQKLIILIKDDGTARSLGFNAIYRAIVALPTTTVISKTMYLGFIYNDAGTKWDLVAKSEEA